MEESIQKLILMEEQNVERLGEKMKSHEAKEKKLTTLPWKAFIKPWLKGYSVAHDLTAESILW